MAGDSGHYIEVEQVQAWLEKTKMTYAAVDDEFEDMAILLVRSYLSKSYDTTTWINGATTPGLILKIISLLVAAWTFDRQYSEDMSADGSYGDRLESMAMDLLTSLQDGFIDLVDDAGIIATELTTAQPSFWPTDVATSLAVDYPEDENAAPRVFSMGKVF